MAGAVCLLSGGLDSTVALGLELERGPVLRALTADYGQRAARREIECSARLARHLGVRHEVVELPFFRSLPAGALLDATAVLPRPAPEELDRGGAPMKESARQVWVPNRNGVLLEVGAACAEALGGDRVVVGFNREEAVTFPDNRTEYLGALSAALVFSTRGPVTAVSPTSAMDKAELLLEAVRLGLPLEHLWPCYEGGAVPCGTCESCQRFRGAARRAGVRITHFRS